MRYLIALLVLSGCTNYSKLSSGKDLAAVGGTDLAGVDFAGRDLAGVDLTAPLEHDGSVAEDMSKPDDLAEGPDMAAPCIGSLANIGAANFNIRFRITTSAVLASTVAYQRADCDYPTSDRWDVSMTTTGTLNIYTTNGAPYPTYGTNGTDFQTVSSNPVNNGAPHDVLITRLSGEAYVYIDGVLAGSSAMPVLFRTLPTLGIASGDPCEGPEGTGGDGEVALVGSITNFCLQTF